MDRPIVYINELLQDTDFLNTNLGAYVGLGNLSKAVLGTTTLLNAFTCTPGSGLNVSVSAGEIYALEQVDTNPYGSIAANTDQIVKQGVILTATTLSCPAPVTVGNSINYLVEISFTETDTGSALLPFYNSANPAQSWQGPSNNGQSSLTLRQDTCTVQVKTGVSAPTGTQTTPSPDANFVSAFVVTVAQGQASISSNNITQTTSNFITETLTQKVGPSGTAIYALDTSVSANTITASLPIAPTAYTKGMAVNIQIANTNTGASTINLNGLGAKNIVYPDSSSALGARQLIANGIFNFIFDGTSFQLRTLNPTNTTNSLYNYAADTSVSANTVTASLSPAPTAYVIGMKVNIKIANTNTGASTINLNGLGSKDLKNLWGNALIASEMASGQMATFEYDGTNFQLQNSAAPIKRINPVPFASTGANVYTPTVGTSYIRVRLLAAGGGGGGTNASSGGGGGGSGSYSESIIPIATVIGAGTTAQVNLGAGGNGGSTAGGNGSTGGNSTLIANGGSGSTLMTAQGGLGGGGNSGASFGAGGLGQSASGGTINITGNPGDNSIPVASVGYGGNGGMPPGSIGGPFPIGSNGNGNSAANNSGAGGSGSFGTAHLGGNGGSGYCVIDEFIIQ